MFCPDIEFTHTVLHSDHPIKSMDFEVKAFCKIDLSEKEAEIKEIQIIYKNTNIAEIIEFSANDIYKEIEEETQSKLDSLYEEFESDLLSGIDSELMEVC